MFIMGQGEEEKKNRYKSKGGIIPNPITWL